MARLKLLQQLDRRGMIVGVGQLPRACKDGLYRLVGLGLALLAGQQPLAQLAQAGVWLPNASREA